MEEIFSQYVSLAVGRQSLIWLDPFRFFDEET